MFSNGCYSGMGKVNSPKVLDSETLALMVDPGDGVDRIFCTAVWISDNQILTAGHCAAAVAEMEERDTPVGEIIEYATKTTTDAPRTAIVLAVDEEHDLALLQALGHHHSHETARVATGREEIGSKLVFEGHPGGLSWTRVEGTVAAYREDMNNVDFSGPFMQVSAPIYFGNSGGGGFNENGELVGIASFMVGRVPFTCFYIPAETIRSFLDKNR